MTNQNSDNITVNTTPGSVPVGFKKQGWLSRNIGQIFLHIALIILAFLVLYPIFLMLINSFKSKDYFAAEPFKIPFRANEIAFSNYELAWLQVADYIINSVVTTVGVTVILVAIATLTAYAFTRFEFPGKDILFLLMLSLMMIPGMLTLISQYSMVLDMGLENNYWGVILPSVSGSIPFAVFLFRTFFSSVPKELFEAAEIDGASQPRMLVSIMLPMSKAIVATLIIQTVFNTWNDYLWPLLIYRADIMKTIPIGLVSYTDTVYNALRSYGPAFAAYVIGSIPLVIVFSVASKQFIAGLTSGAFKM